MADAITKNRQQPEVLRRLCQEAFHQPDILLCAKELTDGFCNTAYDLTLRNGRSAILKVAPLPGTQLMSCEVALMETEVAAMGLAAAQGIPGVPQIFFYDDSLLLCTSACFAMEKLEGESFASAKERMDSAQIAAVNFQTGAYLRRLHQIKGTRFGHFCRSHLQRSNWFDAFSLMMRRVVQDGIDANIDIGVPYAQILDALAARRQLFEEVAQPSFLHWDSWDGNIFVKDGKIVGLIDWERAMWGDPLMEDRFRAHTVNADFLKGYGIEALSPKEKARCRWYDVYLYLIMMIEVTYRQYPTHEQFDWVQSLFLPIWQTMTAE